ncbi:MAG: AraC family transcriptional regulator [Sphaerochaetaceae bacterium]|nr:AraC family transcriptional regulator [Sphaerochaetaceae bacterium]
MTSQQKKEGFLGERLIVIPFDLVEPYVEHPLIKRLYPTDAGYFPSASHHYRDRQEGESEYILLYCTAGLGFISLPEMRIKLYPGEVFCIPKGMRHTYYADEDDPWSILWFHFKGTDFALYPLDDCQVIYLKHPKEQERLQALFIHLFDALEGSYTLGNFVHASQLLSAILSGIYFKEKTHTANAANYAFTKAIRYLYANLHRTITLHDLTQHLMLSKSYIHTLFQKHTQQAPIEYFIHLKMEQACRYLHMTDLQVQEIAQKLGYNDVCYFSRAFKQSKGVSPRTYRNRRESVGIFKNLKPNI